jgi:hypothetical protein
MNDFSNVAFVALIICAIVVRFCPAEPQPFTTNVKYFRARNECERRV